LLRYFIVFIGVVKKPVVSTVKHKAYTGQKLLLVRAIDPVTREEYGDTYIAIDFVDAGEGDVVLVSQEGDATRMVLGDPAAPVRSFIVAVIENWKIDKSLLEESDDYS